MVDKVWFCGASPRRPRSAARAAVLACAAALAASAPARVSGQVPPDERWRTLETEHFRVTFPEGMEEQGKRVASHAERAWTRLSETLPDPPEGRTEILLTDHVDVSNGFARVAPYKRIVVYARPPVDGFALSHFDDWLELVVTHELAHVFHLDVPGDLASLLRAVFGNVPVTWPFFPQLSVPTWAIEGLATWHESELTKAGRVHGTQHEMTLRTAVLEGRFEDIDEASGDSPVWPGGSRPYVYGSLFFDHLLSTYGPERLEVFVDAVGDQWIPYRLNAAARRAFGVSFTTAWREWSRLYAGEVMTLRAELEALAPLTEPRPVTRSARFALYPQVSPNGERLLFARIDGRSDAQLRQASLDGSAQEKLTRTNGTSVFSWLPDGGLVFAQLHFTDPYRVRSDLHVLESDGTERRVTRGARIDHPSAAPDGRTAVAIRYGEATTGLVEVDLDGGTIRELTPLDVDVHWAFPRVSPDGRWIAASRWLPGAFFDVVILDRTGAVVAEVTRDRAVDLAPSWSPDGRWLVWASDRSGIPNLVAAPVEPDSGTAGEVRQVTNLLTGAAFPSVDPSGRWIYFSGYHVDGWEVERIPFDPTTWTVRFPMDPRFGEETEPVRPAVEPPDAAIEPPDATIEPYSPVHTFLPRYWEPEVREPITAGGSGRHIIGRALGFSTSASDMVERHFLDLFAVFSLGGGETDGALTYTFAGLGNPVLEVSASQFWDAAGPLIGRREDDTQERLWLTERERSLAASALYRIPGFRLSSSVGLGGGLVWESRSLLDDNLEESTEFRLRAPTSRLGDARATASLSTARGHAFSISLEEGVTATLQGRTRRELGLADSLAGVPGSDRAFNEAVGRLRAYTSVEGPGFADHVLALQVSAGVAGGPGADGFHFDVGGNPGLREPVTGFSLFGGPFYFFPVRGYANGTRSGRTAWSLAAEYRFPLLLVNEGLGLFPLHVDRLSGALFFDAGNAWGPELGSEDRQFQNPRQDALTSLGGEVLADLLTFFSIPLTLRTGVAFPLLEGAQPELYVRIGRPF